MYKETMEHDGIKRSLKYRGLDDDTKQWTKPIQLKKMAAQRTETHPDAAQGKR